MRPHYDIIVAGAGPAGTSAAASLAKHGFRVLIVEKERLPKSKPCAGGLVIRGLRRLPREITVPVQTYCHKTRVYVSGLDLYFFTKKPTPIIAMAMREEFDNALTDFALLSGAELKDGCEVKDAQVNGTRVRIDTTCGDFSSDFLVAADGALSVVARKTGIGLPGYLVPAIECEVRVSDKRFSRLRQAARFDMGFVPQGYSWVFPKKEHLSVGIGRMRKGKAALCHYLQSYLRFLGLEPGNIFQKKSSVIRFCTPVSAFAKGRVLLTGDAAGLADPLTAEGISSAILSGQLAAEAIKVCGTSTDRAAAHYQALLERHILPDIRIAAKVGKWVYDHPLLMKTIFLLYGERLCEAMMEVMAGEKSYYGILANPFTYLRPFRLGGRSTRRTKIDKEVVFG